MGSTHLYFKNLKRCIIYKMQRSFAQTFVVCLLLSAQFSTVVHGRYNDEWTLGDIVGGAILGAGAIIAAPAVLGFGAAGVTAGSIAAGVQTATTAAGGAFATMQSVGAAGVGAKAIIGGAAAGGAAGAAYGRRRG